MLDVCSDGTNICRQGGNKRGLCKTSGTPPEKQSPDALAGAVGAELRKRAHGKIAASRRSDYRIRELRATTLALAIRDAHPDDARQLLTAALIDLSAGAPLPVFLDVREDARWWSSCATPTELLEYMVEALRALGETALHLSMRKRLLARLVDGLSAGDREALCRYAAAGRGDD